MSAYVEWPFARHCALCSVWMLFFNPPNSPMKQGLPLSLAQLKISGLERLLFAPNHPVSEKLAWKSTSDISQETISVS